MTASWLTIHASYIDSNNSINTDQITFSAGPIKNASPLKVTFVDVGFFEDGTPLTVKDTVANNISKQTSETEKKQWSFQNLF